MVRSLVVVLAAVAVILILTHRADPDPVKVVDPQPMLAVARMQASFPVLIPQGVAGLRPTSVRWQPTAASGGAAVWHVGYLTDDGQYLQVSQSSAGDRAYLAEQTTQGQPQSEVVVAGRTWKVWQSPSRTSLVSTAGGITTVVSGTMDVARLSVIAGALTDA